MTIVILRGRLSSAPVLRPLGSGSVLISLELTTLADDGAQVSVPVAWFDPGFAPEWGAGTELAVTGVVKRRFFRSGGVTQTRTEVVATEVVETSKRRQVQRMLARMADRLGEHEGSALRSI